MPPTLTLLSRVEATAKKLEAIIADTQPFWGGQRIDRYKRSIRVLRAFRPRTPGGALYHEGHQSGHAEAHAPAGEEMVTVSHLRIWPRGHGEALGVAVCASVSVCALADQPQARTLVHREVVFATERFDATIRNRIGALGAFVYVPPSTKAITAAVARADAALAALRQARCDCSCLTEEDAR